jgi:hypothetical protein
MKVPRQKIKSTSVKGLLKRLEEYDRFFEATSDTGEINHQATKAYMSLIKLLWVMAADEETVTNNSARSPEEMRLVAEEILKRDYGIER